MAIANYAQSVANRRQTPQTEPIPGRTDQVQNNAGGFVFQVNDWDRLDRFLILGAEGGTFYVSERDLVKQSHEHIVKLIKSDGLRVVARTVEISQAGRAPKNDPALYTLALVFTYGDESAKAAASEALPQVARIGTHLFHFVTYADALRGWGRGLRNAVGSWYARQSAEELAYQVTKYQSRDKWSHRDVLRKSHPAQTDREHEAIYRWIVGGQEALGAREITRKGQPTRTYRNVRNYLPQAIEAFEAAKKATSAKEIVKLIEAHNLPRECIPTQFLNEASVWEALLQKMPMTAMIRNLAKMTAIGLVGPLSAASRHIVERLGNQEALRKARVHPIQVLLALKTYEQGHGEKGSLSWTAVPAVTQALDKAFYLAFGNVVPTGKNILYALDVSGSMSCGDIAGAAGLTPRDGSAALALVLASTEQNYHIMGFSQRFIPLEIRPGMSLTQAVEKISNLPFEGTDCSLPMVWAKQQKAEVDAFVVLTDNETWAGGVHPTQALNAYRQQSGRDAKLVVVGMTATDFTIADPNDKGSLDVVGFDGNCPTIISDFIRGFGSDSPPKVVEPKRKTLPSRKAKANRRARK
ncbi:MAG: TROVE domain-containing protein [Azonexus sp.]